MAKLRNKVALITGGGTGIGKTTAKLFANEGARIAIIDWAEEAGERSAKEINMLGGEAYFF